MRYFFSLSIRSSVLLFIRSSVLLFFCYHTCKRVTLQISELIFMNISTSDPLEKEMKVSTLRVTMSKVKMTQHLNSLQNNSTVKCTSITTFNCCKQSPVISVINMRLSHYVDNTCSVIQNFNTGRSNMANCTEILKVGPESQVRVHAKWLK